MNRLLNHRRKFYIFTGFGFVIWMLFFDANDLRSQARNWWKLRELEQEKVFYQDQMAITKVEQKEVLGNQRLRIKYAREKYLMKKRNEDVFVLVNENDEPLEK